MLDGGFATLLEALAPDTPLHPLLWSAGHVLDPAKRALTIEAHLRFLRAGCDILSTSCSYQASVEGFSRSLPEITRSQAEEYVKVRSVRPILKNAHRRGHHII